MDFFFSLFLFITIARVFVKVQFDHDKVTRSRDINIKTEKSKVDKNDCETNREK